MLLLHPYELVSTEENMAFYRKNIEGNGFAIAPSSHQHF